MSYRIGKTFSFDAAHRLPGLREGHKCGRLHGHTYTVEVVLTAAQLTVPGFVTDFGDLRPLKEHIDARLDHQNLDDVMEVPSTSEAIAQQLAEWFVANLEPTIPGELLSVRVSETPTSWAEYTVPGRS